MVTTKVKTKTKTRTYPVYRGAEAIQFLVSNGILWYLNRAVCHVLGVKMLLDEGRNEIVIEDHRDYPNTVFSPEVFRQGQARFQGYLRQQGSNTMELRRQILGFKVQESANPAPTTTSNPAKLA